MVTTTDLHRTVDAVWKLESARIVAGLARMVHDIGLAEELAQDALVAALEQWPASGIPGSPGAWLMAVAKRRAVDHLRRSQRLDRRHAQLAHEQGQQPEPEAPEPETAQDDILRLMFISCHPVLATEARVALTLRVIGGLTAAEIARAFLVSEQRIVERIAGAKRRLAQERVPFALPDASELAARLSSVLEVIYLVFNEGYAATSGDDLIRPGLCHEALRLGRLLAGLAPGEAEVHGLVALMEIQASRSAARTGPSGEPVQLTEQNRGRWDQLLIRRGFSAMLRAREAGGPAGPYVLQAAIAVCHAQAPTARQTDWPRIASLYAALARLLPTPVVALNRAVAVGMAYGPQAGLAMVEELTTDPALQDYHLLPGVRADLLFRLDRFEEARREFLRAAALTGNAAERAFLHRRADEARDLLPAAEPQGAGPAVGIGVPADTLGRAAEDFLGREDLDAATVRSYGQTLRRLRRSLGDQVPLTALTAEQVAGVFSTAWGTAAAPTWNRHRSAIRSFGSWASRPDLAVGLDRRTDVRSPTPAIGVVELAALWDRTDLPVRERTLWRLLHESAATVTAVLSLDVEQLDLDDRRARVGGVWLNWRSGAARLLPELLAGRTRGPLFLADRRPGPARMPSDADRCPETGRGRLSYERAEYLFKQATKPLDPTGHGYTLRQLRPRR
ncbi:sigma-70 family RNA polymerase sigma factor [Plantactinospora soyae]|uniref:RNA polymerase sigma factor n=1 Tax=Plantactinospora soyae TaxID=1544732 RepID=A0A927MEY5_9ACTN|nr:sigma-70 family RNA polymerase sigma factor [Plantactinospora soyae]MBE1490493.1 RNA polymerase sigma factor (sigma-70 family) [Plantactinospora soyae]